MSTIGPLCLRTGKALTESGFYFSESGVYTWMKTEDDIHPERLAFIDHTLNQFDDERLKDRDSKEDKLRFALSLQDASEREYALDWIRLQ